MQNTIPFIHNYCDRWCERCYFTSRCSIYEDPNRVSSEERDINNKAFWDALSKNFEKAITFLHEIAAQQGIDLSSANESIATLEKEERRIEQLIKNNPVYTSSHDYAMVAHAFLNKDTGLQETGNAIKTQLSTGTITPEEAENEVASIKECVAVINWYHHFIHVKINRALNGKYGYEAEGRPYYTGDSDGSAKIALIALDRSMQAWHHLYTRVPELEDDALKSLALLQKIKKLTEEEFPNAWKFVRPGFDEEG